MRIGIKDKDWESGFGLGLPIGIGGLDRELRLAIRIGDWLELGLKIRPWIGV